MVIDPFYCGQSTHVNGLTHLRVSHPASLLVPHWRMTASFHTNDTWSPSTGPSPRLLFLIVHNWSPTIIHRISPIPAPLRLCLYPHMPYEIRLIHPGATLTTLLCSHPHTFSHDSYTPSPSRSPNHTSHTRTSPSPIGLSAPVFDAAPAPL